ncbi:MAG: hypothetical protein AMS17_01520 [Spirochaetes bacterium DG_61]|nr:MAG: hypothetical protein AMS17_01520 [Spirochaetes bacterium DG_61]
MEKKKQKAIEEQALDIMKHTTDPEIEGAGIDEDLLRRLNEADASELDRIEQELGIGAVGEEEMQEPADSLVFGGENAEEDPDSSVLIDADVIQSEKVKVDGKFEIHIAEDRMSVTIDLVPSRGAGVPLTFEKVRDKLLSMKVVYGVNHDLLKRAIETAERTKEEKKGVLIAQGTLPEEGKDGSIEYQFSESADIFIKDEEEGNGGV